MKAAVLYEVKKPLVVEDVDLDAPGPGEVKVRLGATAICHAVVNRAQVRPFQSVAVIGTGGVGLNAIQGAAFSGAHPVIAVDLLDNKLEAARRFGATHTVNASNMDPVQGVKDITSGRGVDYSFIMAASSRAVRQAFEMLGPRGLAVMVQISSGDMSDFSPREFIGERTFTGSMLGSTRLQLDVPRYVEIYRAGRLKLDELVTELYSLEDVNAAVESSKSGGALRNVIVF